MIYSAISFTPEGGLALRMINKTGAASVKGEVVTPGTSFKGYIQAPANEDMPTGVVYDAGIADGSPCRVVIAGAGQVLMKNTIGTTVGDVLWCSDTAGRADAAATIPASTFHFRELGHALETVTGGTDKLVWTVLHFN